MRLHCARRASDRPRSRSSTERRRLDWCSSLAASRRRAGRAGLCACWPGSWSPWRWWSRSPRRRSCAHSKKRTQAPPTQMLRDSSAAQRRVRRQYGGRAGGLPPPLRLQAPGGVPGRTTDAVGRGDPATHSRRAGSATTLRLRVRTLGYSRQLHAHRALGADGARSVSGPRKPRAT